MKLKGSKKTRTVIALDGQQIVRLGINFSKETRNIENVLIG